MGALLLLRLRRALPPHVFDEITAGKYGAFITEFVAAQPEQLLYLLASEACQREVAKPAIA